MIKLKIKILKINIYLIKINVISPLITLKKFLVNLNLKKTQQKIEIHFVFPNEF